MSLDDRDWWREDRRRKENHQVENIEALWSELEGRNRRQQGGYLNLPKHSYVFLRKHLVDDRYQVSAISASDVLKRNTDSLRCAVENDVFASLPQDSLLDELEMGWEDVKTEALA